MGYDICQMCAKPTHRCVCVSREMFEETIREVEILRAEVERLTAENDRLNARDANPRALKMPTLAGETADSIRVAS